VASPCHRQTARRQVAKIQPAVAQHPLSRCWPLLACLKDLIEGRDCAIILFGSAQVPSPERGRDLLRTVRGSRFGGGLGAVSGKRDGTRWRAAWPPRLRERRCSGRRGRAARQCHRNPRRARHHGSGQSRCRDATTPSIGFNISLPAEQQPNPYSIPELTLRFHYFCDVQDAFGDARHCARSLSRSSPCSRRRRRHRCRLCCSEATTGAASSMSTDWSRRG